MRACRVRDSNGRKTSKWFGVECPSFLCIETWCVLRIRLDPPSWGQSVCSTEPVLLALGISFAHEEVSRSAAFLAPVCLPEDMVLPYSCMGSAIWVDHLLGWDFSWALDRASVKNLSFAHEEVSRSAAFLEPVCLPEDMVLTMPRRSQQKDLWLTPTPATEPAGRRISASVFAVRWRRHFHHLSWGSSISAASSSLLSEMIPFSFLVN